MRPSRLKIEIEAMSEMFSPPQFEFFTDKLVCAIRTGSNKVYTVQVDLTGNYPIKEPKVFVTDPQPLLTSDGQTMLDANPAMYTLAGENGWVRVCICGSVDWYPNILFLCQIVTRARMWLEAYEEHLKTGNPIDNYLDDEKLQADIA